MSSKISNYFTNSQTEDRKCQCNLRLSDFQWRFAVSSLHSTLPKGSSTFIQLKLILEDPCRQNKRRIQQIEMQISEFKKFYKQMENINNMLSIMKYDDCNIMEPTKMKRKNQIIFFKIIESLLIDFSQIFSNQCFQNNSPFFIKQLCRQIIGSISRVHEKYSSIGIAQSNMRMLRYEINKKNQHSLFIFQQKFLQNYIQFSMLNILSRQQQSASSSLRYIAPLEWWESILDNNTQIRNSNDLIINQLKIENFIQPIQQQQKEAFIKMVGNKVNFLQIDNIFMNPKLKTATKWKPVSLEFLELLKKKIGFAFSLPLIFLQDIQKFQDSILIDQNKKFQIVKLLLCSNMQNHFFYGYIGKEVNIKKFIDQLIEFFDYYATKNTKVTFLQTNELINYKFDDFNKCHKKIQQLIMIHSLQRLDQKLVQQTQTKIQFQQFFISNFESSRFMVRVQRNADQMTMADEDSRTVSEHTMSTGAETPFTFVFQDQEWNLLRPYHKNALFGDRLEQQIENMKQYAREAIYTDIIQLPLLQQEIMIRELDKLAQYIEQNIQKKKMYQKQIAKDSKDYFKDIKESHHIVNIRDKEIFLKQSKEISLHKKIESQLKIKENFQQHLQFSSNKSNK